MAPVEERKQFVIENRSNLYAAQMNLAFQAAEQPGGIECVSNLTSQWLPENAGVDRRGWEWYYLESRRHGEGELLTFRETRTL